MKDFKVKKYTHLVLKNEDISKHLTANERETLNDFLAKIYDGRKASGQEPVNHYLICNKDEHYSEEVADLIKEKIMLRDVIENDIIGLGEEGEWFAIEREVFDKLFIALDPIDTSSGFDEEELMKLLLIDWVEFYSCGKAIDVEVQEWYNSIEIEENEELYYRKDIKKEGKHYSFHCCYDYK